jgi:hypothetical protein
MCPVNFTGVRHKGNVMADMYDLTTTEGWRAAVSYLRDKPVIGTIYAPYFWIADKIIDAMSPGKVVEKQSKAASDLIKAGKDNGVKKMKITMDEQAGAHLDIPIEGVKVSIGIGSKGKTIIEVEYA